MTRQTIPLHSSKLSNDALFNIEKGEVKEVQINNTFSNGSQTERSCSALDYLEKRHSPI